VAVTTEILRVFYQNARNEGKPKHGKELAARHRSAFGIASNSNDETRYDFLPAANERGLDRCRGISKNILSLTQK